MESNQMVLKDIIEKMPSGLSDMEKARYLYIEVCRFYLYNLEFVTGDAQKKTEIFDEEIDINQIANNKGICSSISRAYRELLTECGIEAECVYFRSRGEGHMEVAFKIGEKTYEADMSHDLARVKIGYRTKGFAKKMVAARGLLFRGFSYLDDDQIKRLDNKLGYTYGLNKDYEFDKNEPKTDISESSPKLKALSAKLDQKYLELEGKKFDGKSEKRVYFDDVTREIYDEMYDAAKFGEYVKSINPNADINKMTSHEQDKYRIRFVMDYINTFYNDLIGFEKRDAFEIVLHSSMGIIEERFRVFCGTMASGKMMSIIRYAGPVAREDLFYKICDEEPISEIDASEVQMLIDAGFKTFKKSGEQKIIQHDKPFQEVTYRYSEKIADYLDSNDNPADKNRRVDVVNAVMMYQKCNGAIANYKKIVFKNKNRELIDIEELRNMHDNFVQYVDRYGFDEYLDPQHLNYEDIGIKYFYEDLELLKGILRDKGADIIDTLDEFKQALKDEVKKNKIPLYHVSKLSPSQMKNSMIKPHYNLSQFGQEFDKFVFASTEDIKTNPYIFSRANGKGMYLLPIRKSVYLMEQGDVDLEVSGDNEKKVVSKDPTYIYYMPVDTFEPQIKTSYDYRRGLFYLIFNNEWTSMDPMHISEKVAENITKKGENFGEPDNANSCEVYAVEEYRDVTEILKHNQVLINIDLDSEELDSLVNGHEVYDCIENNVIAYICQGRLRYINKEAEINPIKLPSDTITIEYDADKIMQNKSRNHKAGLRDLVDQAITKKINFIEYSDAISAMNKDENER